MRSMRSIFFFICFFLAFHIFDLYAGDVSVSPPVIIKKPVPPSVHVIGYEENVLILGINPDINTVENITPVESILEKYTDKANVNIQRINPAVSSLKEKTTSLKETEYNKLPRVKKTIFSSYKIKFREKNPLQLDNLSRLLKKDKNVAYVQKNYLYQITMEPDDPAYLSGQLWGITTTNTNTVWDKSQGEDIVVAILDTGFDYNHPDICGNLWSDSQGYCGYDFSDQDNDPMDFDTHGTHVGGIIAAAGNNGMGIIGVAPRVKLMVVKVFPNAYSDVLAQGLRYAADNGAQIINNSWAPEYRRQEDALVNNAIDYAHDMGATVVFAAGNSDDDVQYYFGPNHPHSIAVGGMNEIGQRGSLSNYGALVDVVAPGMNIFSLNPGGQYVYMSGTSVASPFVAGLAALIKAANPGYTNTDIRDTITTTAVSLAIPLFPNAGLMDSRQALQGNQPAPPPVPLIQDIPDVNQGETIVINGSNFLEMSQVVITDGSTTVYATIIDFTDTRIRADNTFSSGTYEVQVINDTLSSNWKTLIVKSSPVYDPPQAGTIPAFEEGETIEITGRFFVPEALRIHIAGNGIDEDAEVTYVCPTAVKISNPYYAGTYEVVLYNGVTSGQPVNMTVWTPGGKPAITYTTINGNDDDNWLNGNTRNNIINGRGGCDSIFGRGGNDILYGGDGDDTYVYGYNQGYIIIDDISGNDILLLSGIDSSEITQVQEDNDHIVYVPFGKITIRNHYTSSPVETISYY